MKDEIIPFITGRVTCDHCGETEEHEPSSWSMTVQQFSQECVENFITSGWCHLTLPHWEGMACSSCAKEKKAEQEEGKTC